jgi:hypothetical protein
MTKKGIHRDSYHIDRVIEEEGYHEWNLQILPNAANVRKYLHYRWDEETRKMVYDVKLVKQIEDDNNPF